MHGWRDAVSDSNSWPIVNSVIIHSNLRKETVPTYLLGKFVVS